MTILDQMSEYEISEGQAWAAQMDNDQLADQLVLSAQFVSDRDTACKEVHFLQVEMASRMTNEALLESLRVNAYMYEREHNTLDGPGFAIRNANEVINAEVLKRMSTS